ncbi:MAG: YicC family protein [Chitinophagales bacterium]|nr:YicC family protein [Chitinophagales bacterium]
MTGYGKAEALKNGRTVRVEIRSLNSKFFDLNLRLPYSLKEKEIEVRNLTTESLHRGKIDLFINVTEGSLEKPQEINVALAKKYFRQLKSLAKAVGADKKDLLSITMQLPEVLSGQKNNVDEKEQAIVFEVIQEAIKDIVQFRRSEGKTLDKILRANITTLLSLLKEVEIFEKDRIETIRKRLHHQLSELISSEEYDRNRFEQELIYYIEKMDFTEEKVRLQSHCDFFLQTLDDKDSNGRRLGFISQEIGREINTLGSKANDAAIQKIIVQMKDELEKIKEQLLNVL